MADDPYLRPTHPLLIVISGPSGAGKDSVIREMKRRGLPIQFVVTATTRAPRPGEVHGRDYLFLTREAFTGMIERGEMAEYALVYNEYKGIPKQQVLDALSSGQDAVLRVDVQGAATVRKLWPEALLIFLTTRNEEELVRRLKSRRTESAEALQLRLATARQEMGCMGKFDYIALNRDDHLEECVDLILAILRAEHARAHPRRVSP